MRSRLREFGLLLGTAVACVFAGEIACRVFLPRPPDAVERLWRYDDLLGWVHEPGRSLEWVIQGTSPTVTINSHGLRDREYDFARSKDQRRMLVLGDSMAWGWGVEHQEVFSERLEARHPDWEIINTAVAGYSTDQQLLYFEHRGHRYDADVVLLLFHPNDADENEATGQSLHNKPAFELVDGKLTRIDQAVPKPSVGQIIGNFIYANTWFLSRVQNRLMHWLRPAAVSPAAGRLAPDGPDVDYLLTMQLLLALDDRVVRSGGRMLVASVPMPGEKSQRIERAVTSTLAYAGVPFQPLTENFAGRFDQLMQKSNGHWNAQGHEVAADAIDVFLREQGVFAP